MDEVILYNKGTKFSRSRGFQIRAINKYLDTYALRTSITRASFHMFPTVLKTYGERYQGSLSKEFLRIHFFVHLLSSTFAIRELK